MFAFNARSGPIPLTLLGCVGDICVWGQAARDILGDRLRGGAHWGYIGEPVAGAERLLLVQCLK